jgi:hypothetical protein
MSARPVKMTVQNYTNKTLVLKSKNDEHGKFVDNPPTRIEASGTWKCSSRDGAMIGPEGTVVYEAEDKSFTVEFYYNHPYGSATSSYRVSPTPSDAITYDIKGSFKGHDQDITFELYAN